jgi:hypothetical protein
MRKKSVQRGIQQIDHDDDIFCCNLTCVTVYVDHDQNKSKLVPVSIDYLY